MLDSKILADQLESSLSNPEMQDIYSALRQSDATAEVNKELAEARSTTPGDIVNRKKRLFRHLSTTSAGKAVRKPEAGGRQA